MNLLTCLPYHEGDYALAKNLLEWIAELGGCDGYPLLLAGDMKVPTEKRVALKELAQRSFLHVVSVGIDTGEAKYPIAANMMFMRVADRVEQFFKLPFLWMEPDCVPMKKGWLSDIASEYFWAPKKFMGPIIRSTDPRFPKEHLNGISVYPNNAHTLLHGEMKVPNKAWDIATAEFSTPRATESKTIFHWWGEPGISPTFRKRRAANDVPNVLTPKIIAGGTAIFHRCKDSSLIDLLREDMKAGTETVPIDQPGFYEAVKV